MVDIYLGYLPVKQIWWKSALWVWNAPPKQPKCSGSAAEVQCETVHNKKTWFLHWKYLQCTPCLCEAWTSNSSLSHSMKCPPRHLIYHDLHDCPHKLSLFANVAYYVARTTRLNFFKKVSSFYNEIWIIRKLLHFLFDKLFLVKGKIDKGYFFLWRQLTQVKVKYCNCKKELYLSTE